MTLHTTPDGQITYEGLPVVNQEEVKRWLWELDHDNPTSYLDWVHFVFSFWKEFKLPDDEFEATKLLIDNCLEYAILRKPVSEEGEKKDKRRIMDDLIYEHLHRFGENNLFRASLDSFRETGKASGSFRAALHAMLEEYRSEGQGEKNKGLGGPSSLEDEAERFFNENYSGTATSDFLKPYIINTYITAVKTRKP